MKIVVKEKYSCFQIFTIASISKESFLDQGRTLEIREISQHKHFIDVYTNGLQIKQVPVINNIITNYRQLIIYTMEMNITTHLLFLDFISCQITGEG